MYVDTLIVDLESGGSQFHTTCYSLLDRETNTDTETHLHDETLAQLDGDPMFDFVT